LLGHMNKTSALILSYMIFRMPNALNPTENSVVDLGNIVSRRLTWVVRPVHCPELLFEV
jgi:hypothetical protein